LLSFLGEKIQSFRPVRHRRNPQVSLSPMR